MCEQLKFINEIKDSAIDTQIKYKIFASVSIAQAILESGWGTSTLAQQYCNLYGIKALRDWTGEVANVDTKEWTKGGVITIKQPFRVYKNWAESILDHAKFLNKDWYIEAGVFTATNYLEQIQAIINGGYCNAPDYIKKIIDIIKKYNLDKFDNEEKGGNKGMKIAVRGGHNFQATGASGIISETVEDRKVKDAVIKYLKSRGIEVLDVTPGNMISRQDLAYGINKAKNWGADMFFSIHFNNCYNSYKGAIGTEVILKQGSPMLTTAKRVNNSLVNLGFKRHGDGIVNRTNLYELNNFNSAMIVEVCFVEATEDVAVYKKVGADAVGKAIVEGLLDVKIGSSSPSSQPTVNSTGTGIVTATTLNVRSGSGTNYAIIGPLTQGQRVKIFKDIGNGWYEIYYGEHGGFVSKDYIKLT